MDTLDAKHWTLPLQAAMLKEFGMAVESKPTFTSTGNEYHFDTGALRGTLRAEGKSQGLTGLIHVASSVPVTQFMGCFSHYRLLDSSTRYGIAGWAWSSTATALPDGGVEVQWAADTEHPFTMRAVYRWASSNALDVTTTVVAAKELRGFEVFLASYFNGFPEVYGYGKDGFVKVTKPMGDWLAFPRNDAAVALIKDGRWQRPPNPVTFKPVVPYAGALGLRRDPKTGLVALVMAPPSDCFAVMMPYGEEGHRSLYLSLFGHDFKSGEQAIARARLVIEKNLSDTQAVRLYNEYLRSLSGATR